MYDITFRPQSNREDWVYIGELVDATDDTPIDITGCTMVFQVNDRQGWALLTATNANGKLTYIDINKFRWEFDQSEMRSLAPGTYNTGLTLTSEDGNEARQISVGPLPVVDGVVP